MLEGINLNNLSVDENGQVSFSGLSTGIDLRGTVDAIIAARRIPVDRLEATVEQNEEKIAALKDVRTILESLRTSLSRLFGQVTFGNNSDIFAAKQAFASSSRVDGTTASAAGNLMGVTVDNAAATSNHTIEILQTAKAHKVSSDQVTNPSAAVGFSASDQFTITSDRTRTSFQSNVTPLSTTPLGSAGTLEFTNDNGTLIGTVSYLATDTITDLANAISVNVTDVTATIDNVGTAVRLNMTGSDAFRMTETSVTGSVLTDFELGVTKLNVNAATTLNDLRDLINQANLGANATGINASVVTVTASESYLVLTANDTGVTMDLADTNGTPLDTLGILTGATVTGNSLGFSEEYDQAFWTTPSTTVSVNATTAPDGTQSADGLIASTTSSTHRAYTATPEPITAGNNYLFSTYAKAGDKNNMMLQVNGTGFGGAEFAEFDLLNGVVVGTSGAAVTNTNVEDVGNGWYRVSMKVAGTATGTAIFEHYSLDGGATFAGDGVTVNTYLWGSQLETVTTETAPSPYVSTSIKIKNELQGAQNAQLYADGVLDQSNLIYESDFQTSAAILMESAGTLSLSGASGALGTVAYTSATTLTQLATDITTNIAGVTAAVVTDGTGVRLEISSATAFTISETGGGSAISDLGIDNKRKVIERASNTIDDLFNGVTLSLFAAEKGTTVTLDVEQDLSQVKTEIFSLVESYNAMRQFVNANSLVDSATGDLDDNAGVLAKSLALSEVASSLSQVIGAGVAGVDANFSVLSQIGVDFVDLTQEDPLLAENLEIDEALLDSMLLSNADDVRKLFTFDMTSGDPRVTLLGFNGRTTYDAAGYTLNLQPSTGDNQFLHSEENENAYWTQQAGVVAINDPAVTAPDGTISADGIVADATNTTHRIFSTETVTAGQSYIFSTYARAGDKDNLLLQVNGAGFGGFEGAEFDLSTGALVGGSPTAGVQATSIEDAGDGWYRVSMKVAATATGTSIFERYPVDVTPTFTGDGSTVNTHVWGAQLEPVTTETTPSSYVRTSATAAVGQAATANIGGTIDGADDGSATVANNVITVNTGASEGLQLFFNGLDYISSIQLDFTVGVGAQMYFQIGDLLDTATGIIDGEIDELTDQNTLNNERITEMMDRLDIQRQNLLERYISMETAVASANRIMESIRQTTEQLAGNS